MAIRVLVTGGAGYIGSILSEHLLDAGYRVTVLDRLLWNQNGPFHLCNNRHYEFVRGDGRDEGLVGRLVKTVDAIIPLAAIVGAPACDSDPWIAESTNLGAIRLINRLRSTSQPVIYPNTNSGYGAKSGDVYCTEETPLDPISLYGRTKVDAEAELLATPNTVSLRLATVFGMSPRMRLDLVVHQMVVQARSRGSIPVLGDGLQWRPFVHVADVCDAMLLLLRADPGCVSGELFNLGGDHLNLTVRELAAQAGAAVGVSRVHSYPGLDDRSHRMDFAKIREELGFVPSRSVSDGAREVGDALSRGDVDVDDPRTMTVQWYRHLLASGANSPALLGG
jgi:nucleoside-diphosphate-sugar epimerase